MKTKRQRYLIAWGRHCLVITYHKGEQGPSLCSQEGLGHLSMSSREEGRCGVARGKFLESQFFTGILASLPVFGKSSLVISLNLNFLTYYMEVSASPVVWIKGDQGMAFEL